MGYIKPPTDGELDAFFKEQAKDVCNKLEREAIAAIEKCLAKGDRAEVASTRRGTVVIGLHREKSTGEQLPMNSRIVVYNTRGGETRVAKVKTEVVHGE